MDPINEYELDALASHAADGLAAESTPTATISIAGIVGDGPYPIEAFQFVQEGLSHTVERMRGHARTSVGQSAGGSHGSLAPDFDMADSRHITGQQLSLGLRDYAIERYGMLAPTVLRHWNILRTEDFGRIVYRLIELGMMSKTPEDSIRDFAAVFEFEEAFSRSNLARRIGEHAGRNG
ncbi:MAG: Minf_1886 family protein [bacterium]